MTLETPTISATVSLTAADGRRGAEPVEEGIDPDAAGRDDPDAGDGDGRGPAWSNSLFEDNAEFGLGMRLAVDSQRDFACTMLRELGAKIGDELTVECDTVDLEIRFERGRQKSVGPRQVHLLLQAVDADHPACGPIGSASGADQSAFGGGASRS